MEKRRCTDERGELDPSQSLTRQPDAGSTIYQILKKKYKEIFLQRIQPSTYNALSLFSGEGEIVCPA
jgi:hypothetical protein